MTLSKGSLSNGEDKPNTIILPWEIDPQPFPRTAGIINDWLEKEGRSADDLERDLWEPMCQLEREFYAARSAPSAASPSSLALNYPSSDDVGVYVMENGDRWAIAGPVAREIEKRLSATTPAATTKQEPSMWWNGIRTYDERSMTYPSVSEREGTHHDIPLYAGANPHSEQQAVWDMLLLDGNVNPALKGAEKLRAIIDALIDARDDAKRLHDEKMALLYGPDGFPRSPTRSATTFKEAIDAGGKITSIEVRPTSACKEPSEEQANAVRGILQIIRCTPGITFPEVYRHCELRGDDLSRWPQWARNETGFVTEMGAACLIYEVMQSYTRSAIPRREITDDDPSPYDLSDKRHPANRRGR